MQTGAFIVPKLRFAANLTFLFPEIPSIVEKYKAASDAGKSGKVYR